MDLQDIFISNLKQLRKERHVTQEKLAELCGTDTAYIGQIETKKRLPSLSFIEKIATAIDIRAYLLFKDQAPESSNTELMLADIKKDLQYILDEQVMTAIRKNISR